MLLFNSKATSYPGENRAMPPRLRYFVYFLAFEMYSASRGPPCDSAASCSYFWGVHCRRFVTYIQL